MPKRGVISIPTDGLSNLWHIMQISMAGFGASKAKKKPKALNKGRTRRAITKAGASVKKVPMPLKAKKGKSKAEGGSKKSLFDDSPFSADESKELLPPPPLEIKKGISAKSRSKLPPPPAFTHGKEKFSIWEDLKKSIGRFKRKGRSIEKAKLREQKKAEKERMRLEKLRLKELGQKPKETIRLKEEELLEQKRHELEDIEIPSEEKPEEKPSVRHDFGELTKLESTGEKWPMESSKQRMEIKKAIDSIRAGKAAAQAGEGIALSAMSQMIDDARDALLNMNIQRAKYIYIELMKIYRRLPDEEKQKTYEALKELYEERKSAERLTRA